jgi:hypothetical protein
MLVWHYTPLRKLPVIRDAGELRNQGDLVFPRVWFTLNQVWESSVNEARPDQSLMTDQEMVARGIARIGVEPEVAPLTWPDLRHIYTSKAAAGLEDGYDWNSWRLSHGPVKSDLWRSIQTWNGSAWINVTK